MATSSMRTTRVGSVEALEIVPVDMAERFRRVYRAALAPLEPLSPARQSLTDEEFFDAIASQSVVKFVGWNDEREACALALMATDLSVVPWISVPYFAARFPEHFGRGAIYYFCALLVRPQDQGGPWAQLLLEELTRMVAADHAVAAFDCCAYTTTVTKLPELIAQVANRVCVLDALELDRQHYFGYVYQGPR